MKAVQMTTVFSGGNCHYKIMIGFSVTFPVTRDNFLLEMKIALSDNIYYYSFHVLRTPLGQNIRHNPQFSTIPR